MIELGLAKKVLSVKTTTIEKNGANRVLGVRG